ncbi:MAG: hypothetical protein AB8U82_06110 [Rickettsia endosymbiont of Haemaphysalis japonica]
MGHPPERFEEISKNTNLQTLLGKKGFSADIVQTNSLNALLYNLNDTAASSKIKDSFIAVLGIDKNKDVRFDKTKTFDKNIAKFKFTKQVLESFITKSKSEAPKIQSKHSVATSHVSRG